MTKTVEEALVLAFDADCSTCRRVSAGVVKASDGMLTAKSLSDPDVLELRRSLLGPEPPWKPTLISVDGSGKRAWVGWKMGAPLARRLGPARTAAVLEALGVERRSVVPSVHAGPAAVSRRRFAAIAAGVLSAGLLLVTGKPSVARAGDFPKGTRSVPVGSGETDGMMARILSSSDVRNVLDDEHLAVLRSGSRLAIDEFDRAVGSSAQPTNGFALTATRHHLPSGAVAMSTGVGLPRGHFLVHRDHGTDPAGGPTEAVLYRMDHGRGLLHTIGVSHNGFPAEAVPDGVVSPAGATASDPCGGCAQTNMRLSPSCATSKMAQCVLSGVGCVGCASACAETVGLACITCVGATCGAALVNCCERAGTPYCAVCKGTP